jgi:molecular chaperone GrpE
MSKTHSDHPQGIQGKKSEESEIEAEQLQKEFAELQEKLKTVEESAHLAQENEKRAVADYQNLMRRTQEEKIKMIKFASRSVVESILQPLEHLFLAKEQLKDKGLEMVYQQFQTALKDEGLEEISVLGKEFDPQMMEVVDKQLVEDQKQVNKVIKVLQRGYTLNGEVIRHAKVIIGVKS